MCQVPAVATAPTTAISPAVRPSAAGKPSSPPAIGAAVRLLGSRESANHVPHTRAKSKKTEDKRKQRRSVQPAIQQESRAASNPDGGDQNDRQLHRHGHLRCAAARPFARSWTFGGHYALPLTGCTLLATHHWPKGVNIEYVAKRRNC